jgi:hypothetical protein
MHGAVYGENVITVGDANLQDSFFTQDTGFITNEAFDTPKMVENHFDSSMPQDHWTRKRREEVKSTAVQYTLRIDDLPESIR